MMNKSANLITQEFLVTRTSLSLREMRHISKTLSPVYDEIANILAAGLSTTFELSNETSRILAKRIIIPIAFNFFDKLIRLKKLVDLDEQTEKWTITALAIDSIPDTIEDLYSNLGSHTHTQNLITQLAPVLSANCLVSESKSLNDQVRVKHKIQENTLFRITDDFKGKLWLRFLSLVGNLKIIDLFWNRLPVFTFANAEPALTKRLFYIKHFKKVKTKWELKQYEREKRLRERVFELDETIRCANHPTMNALTELGLSSQQIPQVLTLLEKYVRSNIPLQCVEGLNNNIKQANRALSRYCHKYILSSGEGGTFTTFLLIAASMQDKKHIGCQHGGYYGYIKDLSMILENELPFCDLFVSWGWSRLPDHPAINKNLLVTNLPSPWLSERAKYWKKKLDQPSIAQYDVLWLPTKVNEYPKSTQFTTSIPRDLLLEAHISMIKLSESFNEYSLSCLCKPFNKPSWNLMQSTYSEIKHIVGNRIHIEDELVKGLTYNLVSKCKITLWDSPGTGFLECLACNIPTLLIWERIWSAEETWCQKDFEQLRAVGIVHESHESLAMEICRARNDVKAWLNEPKRKQAVLTFCQKFAKTSNIWWREWEQYLKLIK